MNIKPKRETIAMKIAERTKARAISETKYTRGISGVYLCRPLLSMTLIVGEGSLPKERGELRTFCINVTQATDVIVI